MKIDLTTARPALLAAFVCAIVPAAALAQEPTPADPIARAIPAERSGIAQARNTSDSDASVSPLVATIELNGGDAPLRGQLISTPQVTVATSFGNVDVPLSEVAGIKVASANNPTTTVVLHNGDSITGACDVGRVDLRTEWGRAEVQGTSINTILFIEGVSWISDEALGGKRWQLLEQRGEKGTAGIKVGDRIVVTNTTALRHGTRTVGSVRKGESLTVERIDGSFVYVNGGNNRAGWLPVGNIQPAG